MSTAQLVAPAAPRAAVPPGSPARGRVLTALLTTQMIGGAGLTAAVTVAGLIAADLGGAGAAGLSFAASVGGTTLALPLAAAIRRWGRPRGLRLGWLGGALGAGAVVAAAVVGSLPALLLGMFLLGGADTSGAVARIAATDIALPERRAVSAGLVVSMTALTVTFGHALSAHVSTLAPGASGSRLAASFAASATVFLGSGRALSTALGTAPTPRPAGRPATPARPVDDPRRRTLTGGAAVLVVANLALLAAGTPAAVLLSVAALKLGVGFGLAFDVRGVLHGHWSRPLVGRLRRAGTGWTSSAPVAVRTCPAW
jgi:hypothetical protein